MITCSLIVIDNVTHQQFPVLFSRQTYLLCSEMVCVHHVSNYYKIKFTYLYCVLIVFISFFIILNKICGIKDAISGGMLSRTPYLVVCYQGRHIWWYVIKHAISGGMFIKDAISGGMLSRTPYLVVCYQGHHIWWYVIKDAISGGMLSINPNFVRHTFCMGVNEHDRKSILIQMY